MKKYRKLISYFVLLLALGFFVKNIWANLPAVRQHFTGGIGPETLLSIIPMFFMSVAFAWSTRVLLASRSVAVPFWKAYAISFIPQFGKYVPGRVWTLFMAWNTGKTLQIPAMQVMYVTICAQLICSLINVLLGCAFLLPFLPDYRLVFLIGGLLAVTAITGFNLFGRLVKPVLTYARIPEVDIRIGWKDYLLYLFALVCHYSFYLLGIYFVFKEMFGAGPADVLKIAGASAIGWLMGYYTLLSPGGLGVREASSYLILSYLFTQDIALVVPIVMRLWLTGYELLSGGISFIFLGFHRKGVADGDSRSFQDGKNPLHGGDDL